MPRPAPNVLLEIFDNRLRKAELILESYGIWAVFYDNAPINLKTQSIIAYTSPKYKKVSFSNKGHAINLAKKLNKKFSTTKFTAVALRFYETVYEE